MGEKKIRDRKENARTREIFLGSFTQEREMQKRKVLISLSLSLSLSRDKTNAREGEGDMGTHMRRREE